jgi:hypothetical protein
MLGCLEYSKLEGMWKEMIVAEFEISLDEGLK